MGEGRAEHNRNYEHSKPNKEQQGLTISQQFLYEETYHLANVRENYLVMVSDSMHVIEIPVGLIKGKVAIGDPIKLKLEIDTKRAESDQKKFQSLQENLLK